MFLLEEKIFDFFGRHAKKNDTYKDANGKGIWQRYNEGLAADYDEQVGPLLNNYVDNLLVPAKAAPRFIPYLEQLFGGLVKIFDDIYYRRKVLAFATRIFQIKGTKLSYEVLLKLAGFTSVNIIEDFTGTGFDSPYTLDDSERRFDQSGCPSCTNYSIELDGDYVELTQELKEVVYSIVRFVEPINARLTSVTYKGNEVVEKIITVNVDEYGNLSYNNDADPTLNLKLDKNGNLQITGPNAGKYEVDSNGNLKYKK